VYFCETPLLRMRFWVEKGKPTTVELRLLIVKLKIIKGIFGG
jgi:hypothetical protein